MSVLVYVAVAAVLGRNVLAHLSTHVANDPGDPLLTAALLQWDATHLPWSDAWWQLPIFYPTRDALAFSEHLLGLAVVASPIFWVTGSTLITYNITTLLTFLLSALTMYALVFRLTRSAAAAFLAGLAFGFAPYRISQLPHIQMLAAFWAPLALLGLHAFIDTGRRRWLALYGACWALQAAANGYALFFFSLLVGMWVLWFVVARRNWRALVMISAATVVALVPLAPILYKYITVHARHGFVRSADEIISFSADVAAVLCAPPGLTFWGWLRVNCRAEGELFPGTVLFAVAVIAMLRVLGWRAAVAPSSSRALTIVTRLLLFVGAVYGAVVGSILWLGPWRLELGPLRVSAMGIRKPLLICIGAFVVALLSAPGVRAAARRSSTLGFYLVAALVTWLLALGPVITFMGSPTSVNGPFAWLMLLPGADSLRVPARFWLMTMTCLAVAAGIVMAEMLANRRRSVMWAAIGVLAVGLLSDGWMSGGIPALPAPASAPDPGELVGGTVLTLPVDDFRDIGSQYQAITAGWRSVNGYSGYGPNYYPALLNAVRFEVDDIFWPFQGRGELHVVVDNSAPRLIALVERQPGVTVTRRGATLTQYRLPARSPLVTFKPGAPKIHVASLHSTCGADLLSLALDRDEKTRWVCFSPDGASQQLVVDLGAPQTTTGVMDGLGSFYGDFPIELTIETSVDGQMWHPARKGSVLGQAIEGGIETPRSLRISLPFGARLARYLRLTYPERKGEFYWSIAELEIW